MSRPASINRTELISLLATEHRAPPG
jgi:hypothetical protein